MTITEISRSSPDISETGMGSTPCKGMITYTCQTNNLDDLQNELRLHHPMK
ncbi:MAG: hypothetical protein ABIY90_12110 [Puia sp.]